MLRRDLAPASWTSKRPASDGCGASIVSEGLALDPTDRQRGAALRSHRAAVDKAGAVSSSTVRRALRGCRDALNRKLVRQSERKPLCAD
jgi:hypothetical protein